MFSSEFSLWFVHLRFEPPLPLMLKRTANLGARVYGGKSGSHVTGHGENYWDKFLEVINLGYMPVEVAKELGKLPADWTAPELGSLEELIQQGFYRHRGQ